MSVVSIVVDSREPEEIKQLTFGGAVITCDLLEFGDLLAISDDACLIAIERKQSTDLLNSIRDNRLWVQLTGLRHLSRWAYLLITGELYRGADGYVCADDRATGWTWTALQSALLQVQEMGVFVVHAASDEDYEATVMRLAARSHHEEMLVTPARAPRVLSEAEQVICSLPGIGPEKVLPILKYASTPAWALSWLSQLESEERVPGIGEGTKRTIRRVLGLTEDEELSVIYANTGQPVKEHKNG